MLSNAMTEVITQAVVNINLDGSAFAAAASACKRACVEHPAPEAIIKQAKAGIMVSQFKNGEVAAKKNIELE
jgi:hypothetical protein